MPPDMADSAACTDIQRLIITKSQEKHEDHEEILVQDLLVDLRVFVMRPTAKGRADVDFPARNTAAATGTPDARVARMDVARSTDIQRLIITKSQEKHEDHEELLVQDLFVDLRVFVMCPTAKSRAGADFPARNTAAAAGTANARVARMDVVRSADIQRLIITKSQKKHEDHEELLVQDLFVDLRVFVMRRDSKGPSGYRLPGVQYGAAAGTPDARVARTESAAASTRGDSGLRDPCESTADHHEVGKNTKTTKNSLYRISSWTFVSS